MHLAEPVKGEEGRMVSIDEHGKETLPQGMIFRMIVLLRHESLLAVRYLLSPNCPRPGHPNIRVVCEG